MIQQQWERYYNQKRAFVARAKQHQTMMVNAIHSEVDIAQKDARGKTNDIVSTRGFQ